METYLFFPKYLVRKKLILKSYNLILKVCILIQSHIEVLNMELIKSRF